MKHQLKWGLALGGGGARGIIHVGVLQAFENHGFKPCCISGTSMGAIAGALYANGMKPAEMIDLLSSKGFMDLFGFKMSRSGLLRMKYLREVLQQHLPETFEELKMPFFAAATNLTRHELTVFRSGPLYDAVVASASIPVLFSPVEIGDYKYVDGGLIDNLPVEACSEHCDRTIGVEINLGKYASKIDSMKDVALEVFHMVVSRSSEKGMKLCDALIQPVLGSKFQLLDFSHNDELYEIGLVEGEKWIKATFH